MNRSRLLGLSLLLSITTLASAQVVPAMEIHDPELRGLQQSSMSQLKIVAQNITAHHFDFPFYCSRKLDIDQKQQQRSDQHSIRFEHFEGSTVLAISGNYYGAYSAETFSDEARARQTFLNVVLPIAIASVPVLENNQSVQGYAIEVSHHVIGKSMGMPIERPENMMVYLPRDAAIKLVTAKDVQAQQAALLESRTFLNANPLNIWLTDHAGQPPVVTSPPPNPMGHIESSAITTAAPTAAKAPLAVASTIPPAASAAATPQPPVAVATPTSAPTPAATHLVLLSPTPGHDASPQALAALQSSIQGISNHMLKELEPQARFIAYAPPAFIAFRHQAYLEISIDTLLPQTTVSSRYKLAALAFDEHISPLIRRVLTYFPGDQNFDGISFSTTVHTPAKPGIPASKPLSVEFFFPLHALHCYESFDCTGQQLLDAGVILINGERVGLDLQAAEGASRP